MNQKFAKPREKEAIGQAGIPARVEEKAPDLSFVPTRAVAEDNVQHYSTKSGVEMGSELEEKVGELADAYHEATGKDIVVTDGNRSAAGQASAIYNKLEKGEDVVALYKNKDAIREIKKAYDDAREEGKSETGTRADMQAVIEKQVKSGTYISRHLSGKGVDVRSRDMSEDDKREFRKAAESAGFSVLEESDHLHLQLEE